MSVANLATYLSDHLSGSVVALELLAHLEKAQAGTSLEPFLVRLHADIDADRKELEALMLALGITASPPRKAMAWLSEKFAELKLMIDAKGQGPFHLFEALEVLAVGIHGKGALWRALAAARIPGPDYQRLEARAQEQRERVEAERLKAAAQALNLAS